MGHPGYGLGLVWPQRPPVPTSFDVFVVVIFSSTFNKYEIEEVFVAPILEAIEQRALFRLTRFMAFMVILTLSVSLMVATGLFADQIFPRQSSHIAYSDIVRELHPSSPPSPSSDQASSDQDSLETQASAERLDIPTLLRSYFESQENRLVLERHVAGLDSDEKKEYLNNMAEVVSNANSHHEDALAVINRYFEDKEAQLDLVRAEKSSRTQLRLYVAAGCISTLLLIAMASLILVLLAIERNTRIRPIA
jgi:hypothetical protein